MHFRFVFWDRYITVSVFILNEHIILYLVCVTGFYVIVLSGMTTACALKMFQKCVTFEKDPKQVNFIKMIIQGIWNCPDQNQEVGAKHINQTEMFKMTSQEPMEPIDLL